MIRQNELYLHYYQINKSAYYDKIRFFEKNRHQFDKLSFREVLEIKSDYAFALFEMGKYSKYLSICDELLETVIKDNIYDVNEKDVFEELLFRKAASLFNLKEYNESTQICKELIAINPGHELASNLFRQCLRNRGNRWYEINKGVAVVFLLSGISVVLAELFVIAPFYENIETQVQYFRNILFIFAFGLLIYNEIWIWVQCNQYVRKYAHIVRNKAKRRLKI